MSDPGSPLQALLTDAEIEAERTTGLVRLVLAVALGAALFVGAALTASAGQEWRDRIVYGARVLAGFTALGVASILVARPGRYARWMAFAFAAGDAAIIVFGAWTSLRLGGLDGNWVAAAPAVWAAPLVLIVGALRGRPEVVLWGLALIVLGLAGLTAAFGFQPSLADAGDVPHIDQAVVLFGLPPTAVRVALFLMTGATIAFVAVRSRALLLRAIREATQRAHLSRFLPAEMVPLLGDDGQAAWRRGRRQLMTIMFVDIRGSTALAEDMEPERLSLFVTAFRRRLMHAAAAHGGVIDKFIGDGALLVFGVPAPAPDDAARAIRCAEDILRLVERWNAKRRFSPPVRVGIGLHSGEAFCGLVGTDDRLEFTVLGDAVNVAARIEQATKPFGLPLLASEATVRAAALGGSWHLVSDAPLRGRHASLPLFAPARGSEDRARLAPA